MLSGHMTVRLAISIQGFKIHGSAASIKKKITDGRKNKINNKTLRKKIGLRMLILVCKYG